jgi:hypothetical protein
MRDKDIIERTPGCSNAEMVESIERLIKIISATKEVKVLNGRKTEIVNKFKHNTEKRIVDRINNSYQYYKNLKESKVQLRDYQNEIIDRGTAIINVKGFLYLGMMVRTGKTLTSLGIASNLNAKNVLFVTKKKAISSIVDDYDMLSPDYKLVAINYESLHLVKDDHHWDVIICDEAHSCFIGDTIVEGKKIKDIELGDYIKSFNFAENKYEYKKVINIFKNELQENLIKIKCNGKEIICTESHKIFTKRGWIEARYITDKDELQIL